MNRIKCDKKSYTTSLQISSASIDPRRDRDRRQGYIAGATAEAQRAEKLVEALENILAVINDAKPIDPDPISEIIAFAEAISKVDKIAKEALSKYKGE